MKTNEHHTQSVVSKRIVIFSLVRGKKPAFVLGRDSILFLTPPLLAAKKIQRKILRGLRQPCDRILRHAALRPSLQGPNQRLLHDILRKLQPLRAEVRSERSNEARTFRAEQIRGDPCRFFRRAHCIE